MVMKQPILGKPTDSHPLHDPVAPLGGSESSGGGALDAELVDVASIPLTTLIAVHGDSPVLRSIRRLQMGLQDPSGVLSAFGSFIDES